MPSFLTCLEAVVFSSLFHWSYSAAEFSPSRRPHRHFPETLAAPRLGTWQAVRDALDLSDVVDAVWVAVGFAWVGLGRWVKGQGGNESETETKRRGLVGGVVGGVVGFVGSVVDKRREGREFKGLRVDGYGRAVSPFDDRAAPAGSGPAVPDAVFGSGPGRTRTFDGDSLWLGRTRGGIGEREYEPLRSNGSRDSGASDRSR